MVGWFYNNWSFIGVNVLGYIAIEIKSNKRLI